MFRQITVFLENKPGRMEEVAGCLAKNNINIHALSIADTTGFGILRMIVSKPEKAADALKSSGFMVKITEVIAVAIEHTPGSLYKVLRELNTLDISIEYLYAFTSQHRDHDAIVILSLNNQDAALEKLKSGGFPILGEGLLDQLDEA